MLYFFYFMIDKIRECQSLNQLAKLVIEDKRLDFLVKQKVLNDLKYGTEEYLNKYKKEIIAIYKK